MLAVLLATPLPAELVLLVDGGVLKVDAYRLLGDEIELSLPSGGRLTLPVLRVDRILADEIESNRVVPGVEIELAFHPSHRPPGTPYAEEIFAAARRHAMNPALVAAIVRTESGFDPAAVSDKGASGLMQLMPSTAERFGLERRWIFDPELNLDAGVRYLRWLVQRFDGDPALVLAGYNAGEGAVERHGGVPPFRETHDYIRRVYSSFGADSDGVAVE